MSKESPSSNNTTKPDTTNPTTDRRQRNGGISDGGRRKVDHAAVPQLHSSSRIWFGLSLILTLFIIIWTFSVPFRTEKPIFAWDKSDLPQRANPVSREILDDPEHQMSDNDYKAYIWEIEANLRELVVERNRVPENLPDTKHAKAFGERKIANMEAELMLMMERAKKREHGLVEGSAEYEAMKNLEKKLAESDEYLPRK